jgi:hypothetical protein
LAKIAAPFIKYPCSLSTPPSTDATQRIFDIIFIPTTILGPQPIFDDRGLPWLVVVVFPLKMLDEHAA